MSSKFEVIKLNGYHILLNKIADAKICKVEALIDDGFINETVNTSGIAHLIEHLLLDSWSKCKQYKSCNKLLTKYGVSVNAETHANMVCYYIEGLQEHLEIMITYVFSLILKPEFNKGRLNKEKQAVVNELMRFNKQDVDLYNAQNEALYINEGLRNSENVDLQIKNLKNITMGKIKEWVYKYYDTNSIVFVISGNFKKNAILKNIKGIINSADKRGNNVIRDYNLYKPGLEVVHLKEKSKKNTTIVFNFYQYIGSPNKTIFYISFFQLFINSSIHSILMTELRENKKLIYNISFDRIIYPTSIALFLEISTTNDKIKETIKVTIDTLISIMRGKFGKEIFDIMKKKFVLHYYQQCQNPSFYTRFYGEQLLNQIENTDKHIKIYSYEDMVKIINKFTKKEFCLFAKKILNFKNMKVVYQGKREIKDLKTIIGGLINKLK